MFNLFTLEATATQSGATGSPVTMIVMMAVLFGAMYFLMIRPQKKQQKKDQEMRDSTQVGDEVRVVTVKEDSIVIETGADRNKMKITRWAIQQNNTAVEKARAEREAAKAAADKAKEEKKNKKED